MPFTPASTTVAPSAAQSTASTIGWVATGVTSITTSTPRPPVSLAHAFHQRLALDVDHVVGAERAGERELVRVAREAGDEDRAGTDFACRDHRGEPALAGSHHQHGVAGLRLRHLGGPPETGAERVEQHREFGGQAWDRPCARSRWARGRDTRRRRPTSRALRRAGCTSRCVATHRADTRRCDSAGRRCTAAASRPRRDRPLHTPQRCAARSPIVSITPSGSCPGISGSGTFNTPWNDSTSLPQIPHASTRNSASSGADLR